MNSEILFCDICVYEKPYYIICNFCNKDACTDCYEKYFLLDNSLLNCMYCKENFNLDFVVKNIGTDFYKKYLSYLVNGKINKRKILESDKIYEIINLLLYLKTNKKYDRSNIDNKSQDTYTSKYIKLISLIYPKFTKIENFLTLLFENDDLQEFYYSYDYEELHDINKKTLLNFPYIRNIQTDGIIFYLRNKFEKGEKGESNEIKIKTETIICKCLESNCHGFIIYTENVENEPNNNYFCNVCNKKICKYCYESLEVDHTCDKKVIENIKYIKQESKICPKCSMSISKIEGCDQMWCVNCHTAFSWNTGKIVKNKNNIHNPHYFDWLYKPENKGELEEAKERELELEREEERNNPNYLLNKNHEHIYKFNRYLYKSNDKILPIVKYYVTEILKLYRSTVHVSDFLVNKLKSSIDCPLESTILQIKYFKNQVKIKRYEKETSLELHKILYTKSILNLFNTFTEKIKQLFNSKVVEKISYKKEEEVKLDEKTHKSNVEYVLDTILYFIIGIRKILEELNESLNETSIIYNVSIPVLNNILQLRFTDEKEVKMTREKIDTINSIINSKEYNHPLFSHELSFIYYTKFDEIKTEKYKKGSNKPIIIQL